MDTTTVRELNDRNEIADLVSRLGVVLDEGRFDEMKSLLAEDVIVRTPGGVAEGHEAVIAQASRNHQPGQPVQHLITNLLLDLDGDGDRAAARANLVVHFGATDRGVDPTTVPAPPVVYTLGEVYRFDLVRTPDGWRLARIDATPVWYSGTPIRPPRAA
jgi:hypothetical protein